MQEVPASHSAVIPLPLAGGSKARIRHGLRDAPRNIEVAVSVGGKVKTIDLENCIVDWDDLHIDIDTSGLPNGARMVHVTFQ